MEEPLDPKTLLLLLVGHLRDRVVSHPASTLGGAAAVGYVLGWSLPNFLLRMGGAMALRAAAMEILDEVLARGSGLDLELDPEEIASHERSRGGVRTRGADRAADPFVA